MADVSDGGRFHFHSDRLREIMADLRQTDRAGGDAFINGSVGLAKIRHNFPQAIAVEMEATAIAHVTSEMARTTTKGTLKLWQTWAMAVASISTAIACGKCSVGLAKIRHNFPQAIAVEMEATAIAHVCHNFKAR
jgi:nucleoside phosphorylase